MSEEPKVSQRYRELAREEPSSALDDAILAASRRAVQTRPAPLVAPTGRRRWYFPVAAAAIIVLAVAVTVHVERQQRPIDVVEAPATAPATPQEEPAPSPQSRGPRDAARRADASGAPAPEAPAQAKISIREERAKVATERVTAALAERSPEQWLQGIADLKRQGRHEEAEKELAEFRKRHPQYRIPEAILEKFEKR